MTRAEAIQELLGLCDEMPSMECQDWKTAICMGIEALKQQPVLDKIQEEIKRVDTVCHASNNHDELIRRNVVLQIIDKYKTEIEPQKIEALKQPIRPKGHWSELNNSCLQNKCSFCGCLVERKTNFCPNCGADMREVEE